MNQTEPFELSSNNGRLEIRYGGSCCALGIIDARNLVSALERTLKSNLSPGLRLPLTTAEIELQNFSEFVNVIFNLVEAGGTKQMNVQLNKQQLPSLISSLRSHVEVLRR
jgi:hypothetical protein